MPKKQSMVMQKVTESFHSVLPIILIVFVLCFGVIGVPSSAFLGFILGTALLIVGMGLFTIGTETAMIPIGEHVGSAITKSRKLWIMITAGLVMGMIITASEPDLQVLAEQVPGMPNLVLILAVAFGVGVFLVLALLRILFAIPIKWLLFGAYALVFVLANFVPNAFLAVAFDSGGVTTGPMTVPFILALGMGVSAIRNDKNAESDSFGLVALSSIGPILAVMLLSFIFKPDELVYEAIMAPVCDNTILMSQTFLTQLPYFIKEVAVALGPVLVFFLIANAFSLHLRRSAVLRIIIGILFTFVGLVAFLLGVNVGFMPLGNYIGQMLGALNNNWILIPIGMLIGYFVVSAEPAVHVLGHQVNEMTAGVIPAKALSFCLSVGVSISVGLSMLRIITGINIMYFLVPGYAIAIILMFFVDQVFTSIAFDSGGVASGPMTATFLLPLAIGACTAVGGDVVSEAFGVIAMVAMTPLIAIQIMGLVVRFKKHSVKEEAIYVCCEEIIEL